MSFSQFSFKFCFNKFGYLTDLTKMFFKNKIMHVYIHMYVIDTVFDMSEVVFFLNNIALHMIFLHISWMSLFWQRVREFRAPEEPLEKTLDNNKLLHNFQLHGIDDMNAGVQEGNSTFYTRSRSASGTSGMDVSSPETGKISFWWWLHVHLYYKSCSISESQWKIL